MTYWLLVLLHFYPQGMSQKEPLGIWNSQQDCKDELDSKQPVKNAEYFCEPTDNPVLPKRKELK